MRHGLTVAVIGTLLATSPLQAQVLLSDNFDAETTAIPSGGLTNWDIGGTVDIVNDNTFGLRCAGMSGKCLDLDGTGMTIPGPRSITTKSSYSFLTGDRMRMSFQVSGNQLGAQEDLFLVHALFGSVTDLESRTGSGVFGGLALGALTGFDSFLFVTTLLSTSPFLPSTIEFVASEAGSVQFMFETYSADNIGPILDNVVIERFAASVPEPSSLALLGLGLAGLVASRRRRVA